MNDLIAYGRLAKRAYDREFEKARARFDLGQSELDVLMFLHNNPECDTARQIEALRGLSKSVVSSALEELWRRGYITRREDPVDRRVTHLALTEAARSAVEAGARAQRAFRERVLSGFTSAERLRLENDFRRIARNISGQRGRAEAGMEEAEE